MNTDIIMDDTKTGWKQFIVVAARTKNQVAEYIYRDDTGQYFLVTDPTKASRFPSTPKGMKEANQFLMDYPYIDLTTKYSFDNITVTIVTGEATPFILPL